MELCSTGTELTVAEEALRMVVLERLQAIWTPENERDVRNTITSIMTEILASCHCVPHGAQAHLLPGKLSRSLNTVVLFFGLQINIQTDTEAGDLIGQELVTRTWSL